MRAIALLAALAIAPAAAAPKAAVVAQLNAIPSVAGGSVYDRMRRCGITVQAESWFDRTVSDPPGETKLATFINVPPPSDDAHDRTLFAGMNAVWIITKDGAKPITAWASDLQRKPPPLGTRTWLNC